MDAENSKMPDVTSDDIEAEYAFQDKVGDEKDLTGDGGCKKTILRLGSGWESPEPGDQVTVHYTGTLTDGTKFDSSRDRDKPFAFELGKGSVIRGWDVGVASMKKGELAQLTLAPAYAYGPAGSPPSIPPEATLVFEVELLYWKSVKDITGDGGVIKTVLAEGKGWQTPQETDEVVLHYTARLVDPPAHAKSAAAAAAAADTAAADAAAGPVVASSPEGGAVFSSLSGLPCSGLVAAVKSMKPEEHVQLLLSPEYAAGLAEVPEGKLLEVEASLAAVHAVTTPLTGVTMKVMTKPDSYSKPNAGSSVKVSVQVTSLDGAVLEPRHEVQWTTDEEQAPDALETCLHQMAEGEHCLITITDPALLAAPAGAVVGAGVPPGTPAAVYDVTLLTFTAAKEKWQMNNAEKLSAAVSRKEKGNAAYKAGKLYRAVKQYTAAYETANSINERDMAPHPSASSSSGGEAEGAEQQGGLSNAQILAQAKDVKKATCLNLAAAALKQQQWGEAVTQASRVLDMEPGNIKALYRRAQGHMGLCELLEAELDIKAGLLAHPDNADLVALARKLKVQAREANKKEAQLYGKMFAALGSRPARSSDQGTAGDNAAAAADAPSAAAEGDGVAAAAPVVETAA